MECEQADANDAEYVEESSLFGKHRRNSKITKLVDTFREKQNILFESYHEIVLLPIIWYTLANLEATIKNGSFETLLQFLTAYVEVEAYKITELPANHSTANPPPAPVNKLHPIRKLRRFASSYSRTAEKGRKTLLIEIQQKFVVLINEHFPQKEIIPNEVLPDECIQRVQNLIEDGEKSLGRWCTRPEIAEVHELVRILNSSDDVQNIAHPRTPLQNARTHPSLTIMMKSIHHFVPFLKTILKNTAAFNEPIQCDLDTPLHYAVRSRHANFIEWLLEQNLLDVNCRNKQMKTPLFILCEQYKEAKRKVRDPKEKADQLKDYRKYILLLLQKGADFNICSGKALLPYELLSRDSKLITPSNDQIQLEEQKFLVQCENVVRAREGGQILKRHDNKFTTEEFGKITVELLEIFLRFNHLDIFEKEFKKIEVKDAEASKVITLLLHPAVALNLEKYVDLIANRYEKVIFATDRETSHLKYRVELKGLLHKACDSANPAVLTKLLCKMEKDKLLINDNNILVYTLNRCAKSPNDSEQKSKLLKCAKLMATDSRIFHSKTDCYGNTALHVALKYGFTDIAKALIVDHKYMFLGVQNKNGETPLDYASYEFCKEYLDQCVFQIASGDILIDLIGINPCVFKKSFENFKEIPKTRPQKSADGSSCLSEMAVVKKMAVSKNLKQLLHHPVIFTFLLVKWLQLSMWHCINLLLTLATIVAFSAFSIICICHDNSSMPLYIASWCGLTFVLGRELLQWAVFGNAYFRSFQNCMDMANILGMTVVMGLNDNSFISALVVIIFAVQIIQLIGSLPFNTISTYRCMFRVVAKNFMKSIVLFCPLLLAFAFSFYLYYNDKSMPINRNGTIGDSVNPFATATATGVKILVMSSGEFEAAAMNISGGLVVIFLLFIFLVPMVMQNLINGLAVSDISEIRKESESISLSEKVLLLGRFECGLHRTVSYKPIEYILSHLRKFSPDLFFRKYHQVIKITVNDGAKIMIDSRYARQSNGGMDNAGCSKLSWLKRQSKPRKGQDVEMGALLNNHCADSTPGPKLYPRKKQNTNMKNRWESIRRIPAMGMFSPVGTLDEPVLEELLSIVNRNEISNAQRPRSESRRMPSKN